MPLKYKENTMSDLKLVERFLEILFFLKGRNKIGASTKDICEHFDNKIPLRTIQRNLETLSNTSMPMIPRINVSLYKRQKIYSIDNDNLLVLPNLSLNEALSAHFLKNSLKIFEKTNIAKGLKGLISKIESKLPEDVFENLDYAKENIGDIQFMQSGVYDYSSFKDIIDKLIEAVSSKYKIELTYGSSNEKKIYTISPLRIMVNKGSLYFLGKFDSNENLNTFVVHKILELKILKNTPIDLTSNTINNLVKEELGSSNRFGVFSNHTGKSKKIKLKFESYLEQRINHRKWHPSQKITIQKDGCLILELDMVIDEEFTAWIMYWKTGVTVLSPKSLITEIKTQLSNTLSKY